MHYIHFCKDKNFLGFSTNPRVLFGASPNTNIIIQKEDFSFDDRVSRLTTDGVNIIISAKDSTEIKEQDEHIKTLYEENEKLAIKNRRDELLKSSDWVVTKETENPGSVTNYEGWKSYRQELRDITKTYKSILDVVWPTPPEEE